MVFEDLPNRKGGRNKARVSQVLLFVDHSDRLGLDVQEISTLENSAQ